MGIRRLYNSIYNEINLQPKLPEITFSHGRSNSPKWHYNVTFMFDSLIFLILKRDKRYKSVDYTVKIVKLVMHFLLKRATKNL